MTTHDIGPYREADRDRALSIRSKRLGRAHADGAVLDAASDPGSDVHCLTAADGGRVVGFLTCRLIGPDRAARELRRPHPPDRVNPPVGLLDTGAVTRAAEGRGVGTRLLQASIGWLRDHDAGSLLSVSWIRDGNRDSSRLLAAAGFEPVGTEERYWYEERIERGDDCPDCGHPCQCTAEIRARHP